MSLERNETSGAIVCMPYSSNIGLNGKIRLSYWSAQSIHATLHLWQDNSSQKIVIPGESVFGSRHPSTASLMVRYLEAKGVSQGFIISRENLNNTALQLEEIKRLQEQEKLGQLLVVCTNWHKERVEQVLKELDISAQTIEVESVIAGKHKGASRDRLLEVPATRRMATKDARLRTNFFTKRLFLQRLMVKIFGARIVDLKDDTYAILRRRQLKKSSSEYQKF